MGEIVVGANANKPKGLVAKKCKKNCKIRPNSEKYKDDILLKLPDIRSLQRIQFFVQLNL